MRIVNLGVRFLLELVAVATAGYWGATVPAGWPWRILGAVAAPATVILVWGLFISPKARIPTGLAGQAGLGLLVFSAAAAMLWSRGQTTLAVTYWTIALVSSALLLVLPE
jgi:hypothetical protein